MVLRTLPKVAAEVAAPLNSASKITMIAGASLRGKGRCLLAIARGAGSCRSAPAGGAGLLVR